MHTLDVMMSFCTWFEGGQLKKFSFHPIQQQEKKREMICLVLQSARTNFFDSLVSFVGCKIKMRMENYSYICFNAVLKNWTRASLLKSHLRQTRWLKQQILHLSSELGESGRIQRPFGVANSCLKLNKNPGLHTRGDMKKTSTQAFTLAFSHSLPLFLWHMTDMGAGVGRKPFYGRGRGWFGIRLPKIHFNINDLSRHSSLKVHQSKYSSFWKVL